MSPHRSSPGPARAPRHPYPYTLPHTEAMVEVVDARDRPLLLMPEAQARAQGLPFRSVRVLVCDAAGRILLARALPPESPPGLWSLPAASVRAGEPREAAALRALDAAVRIEDVALRTAEKKDSSRNPHIFFLAELPPHTPVLRATEGSEILLLDRDELYGLAQHFPELLAPELLHCLSGAYMDTLLAECSKVHSS